MSDYLNELRDSARQVVAGAGTPMLEDTTWPLIVELGWLLTLVPEELDGLGLGALEATALHGELGKGLNQAAFLPAMLVIDALCRSDVADKAELIGRFTTGDLATASLAEPTLSLANGNLSGVAAAVQSADKASCALLWTSDEQCLALIDLHQPGVAVAARDTWDSTRRLFDVTLTDVPVANQLVLASGAAAAALIARLRTLRDFALAADALGGGAALLDLTVDHLRTRKQFGRPLALFQALKHRCADLKNILAASDALLNDSLLKFGGDIDSADAQLAAKKAKYLACATYSKVAEECLQLSGGIGMAEEYPCHLYLKRAMLSEHLGMGEAHYPEFIADQYLASLAG